MFRTFTFLPVLILIAPLAISQESKEIIDRDERHPNVLFITVDDLRPSIGCYADARAITPNIDRLADAGVRFDRAYCQVAVCNPSRASLMTGLRPDKLGVWTLPIHFREAMPAAVTLPQWFRSHGYTAVSQGKIFHNPTPDPQSWSEPIRDTPRLECPYPKGTEQLTAEARRGLCCGESKRQDSRDSFAVLPPSVSSILPHLICMLRSSPPTWNEYFMSGLSSDF